MLHTGKLSYEQYYSGAQNGISSTNFQVPPYMACDAGKN